MYLWNANVSRSVYIGFTKFKISNSLTNFSKQQQNQFNNDTVFTQGPGGVRASGVNSGSSPNGNNNANGVDKSRTSQPNSGDMSSSSHRPGAGWSIYLTNANSSVKYSTNPNDVSIFLICSIVMLSPLL